MSKLKKKKINDVDRVLKRCSDPRKLAALLLLAVDNYEGKEYARDADNTPFGNLPTVSKDKQRKMKKELEYLGHFISDCCPSRMGLTDKDVDPDEGAFFLTDSLKAAKKYGY